MAQPSGSPTTRRQFLAMMGATGILGPVVVWMASPSSAESEGSGASFPVTHTDAEWRARLEPDAYRVLRSHATERPFSSPLDHEKRPGVFVCAGCGHSLFDAATKFDSGTGWPSFWQPVDGAVGTTVDRSYFLVRTEVHCANCGGHLGHVFADGPRPTGLRYCMNGAALTFRPNV